MKGYIAENGDIRVKVEFPSDETQTIIDGRAATFSHVWLDDAGHNLLLLVDGRSYDLRIEEEDGRLTVIHRGNHYHCTVLDERLADLRRRAGAGDRPAGRTVVKSPMPGLIVKILVEVGQEVKKGDRLLILEAMKMENDVKAPRPGKVTSLSVAPGQAVEGGRELAIIE